LLICILLWRRFSRDPNISELETLSQKAPLYLAEPGWLSFEILIGIPGEKINEFSLSGKNFQLI
jgi:hypothetical protein